MAFPWQYQSDEAANSRVMSIKAIIKYQDLTKNLITFCILSENLIVLVMHLFSGDMHGIKHHVDS